ncbi:MAG: glycosyltransferase [Kiloniellales bacterium]|nr:glycosyltransferase [Kiloniellales bacterium]
MDYIINFIHDGKAIYPDIDGYRDYFSGTYEIRESSLSQYRRQGDPARTILWVIMGFYPRPAPPALATIHDYRSLSVGALAPLKDRLKKLLNFKPDLRIIQNEVMSDLIGFSDGVPELFLDMGVRSALVENARRSAPQVSDYDFVYIGTVSRERQIDVLIESFLRRYPRGRRFLLIGPADENIVRQFMDRKNVVFTGRVPQAEAFDLVMKSKVAISFFPSHRPHCFQTPTKLIEYAALGRPILANDSPMNLATIRRYNILATVTSGDTFASAPEPEEIAESAVPDPCPFTWPRVIADSGVEAHLETLIADREARR